MPTAHYNLSGTAIWSAWYIANHTALVEPTRPKQV